MTIRVTSTETGHSYFGMPEVHFAKVRSDGALIVESRHHSMDHSPRQWLALPADRAEVHRVGVSGDEHWAESTYEVRLDGVLVATVIEGDEADNSCNYSTQITVHALPSGCVYEEYQEGD